MRIILDTGALWRPDAIRAATGSPLAVIVPAIAYAERARQFGKRGWPVTDLDDMLAANEFVVEPLTVDHARRHASGLRDDAMWRRLSHDALIAGHVEPEDELWTTNPQDFLEIGVPPDQVVAF